MKQNYFYIIDDSFFEKYERMGCKFKYNKSNSRPIYCCIADSIHHGLFWAIPTGTIHGKNMDRIDKYLSADKCDIRSSFYHIGYTNRKALFYISSAFPIIDKYVLREYTTNNMPLVLKREKMIADIRSKLLKILTYENKNPNKFETHITDIKNDLLSDLNL